MWLWENNEGGLKEGRAGERWLSFQDPGIWGKGETDLWGGGGGRGGCPPGPLVRMSGPGRKAVIMKKLVLDPGCRAAVN